MTLTKNVWISRCDPGLLEEGATSLQPHVWWLALMLRHRTVLLVGGVVAVLGAVIYAMALMQGTLYVTACQPGAEWSNTPGCRQILLQAWAGIVLVSVGIAIIAYGFIVRMLKARSERNRS